MGEERERERERRLQRQQEQARTRRASETVEHREEWLRNRRVRNRARRTRDRAILRRAARCNCSSPVTEGLDEVTEEDVAVSWLGAVI